MRTRLRVASDATSVVNNRLPPADKFWPGQVHGRRQDDFHGGAPDNFRGVQKDFPIKGVHIFSMHKHVFKQRKLQKIQTLQQKMVGYFTCCRKSYDPWFTIIKNVQFPYVYI